MALHIGEEAPNFTAETTEGTIDFHEWIGDGWAILFFTSQRFLLRCVPPSWAIWLGLKPEFDKRNCKIIGPEH